ncbi:PKD domain-containing protein [Methanosphaerula palustris]|uniref:PKD domain-containing protein n=1 Tax=Methanosphaerula palustris TaxID=475088 RepID=UPI000324EE16|nr:PKD domain-containing protein [Methanosphaerula palustris]
MLTDTNVTQGTPTPTQVSYADAYPRPNFTADRTNGTAPLTIRFTNESSEWAYNWRWTFGDGGSSREQNPVHTFQNPGAYPVILSIDEHDHWSGGTFVHFWNLPDHEDGAGDR